MYTILNNSLLVMLSYYIHITTHYVRISKWIYLYIKFRKIYTMFIQYTYINTTHLPSHMYDIRQ